MCVCVYLYQACVYVYTHAHICMSVYVFACLKIHISLRILEHGIELLRSNAPKATAKTETRSHAMALRSAKLASHCMSPPRPLDICKTILPFLGSFQKFCA